MHSTDIDDYPSRSSTECTTAVRADPVVWGDAAEGPLSPSNLARYEDKGFHLIPSAMSDSKIADCYAEIARLAESPQLSGDDPRVVREKATGDVRSIFDVHLLSDIVAHLARQPLFLGLAQQILGSDVYIHQSRLNYKPGFTGGPFYWHSDFETWHTEDGMPRPRAVSISVALTPNYEVNGSLMIIPGSHHRFVSCAGETPKDYYRQSLVNHIPQTGSPDHQTLTRLADEFGIEQITGPSGSATVFDSNCMHGSNGNITPYPRSNLFLVYNSVENRVGRPYAAAERRPDFLAKQDFTALKAIETDAIG